jgi:putative endonuclease
MDILLPERKRHFGQLQEQIAAQYLLDHGLELICSNFHCRSGEIDLIMREQEILVFVEVRYRRSEKFGSAIESVDLRKQSRLLRCAQYFLISNGLSDKLPCRFDILGLSPALRHSGKSSAEVKPDIVWLRNAFGG